MPIKNSIHGQDRNSRLTAPLGPAQSRRRPHRHVRPCVGGSNSFASGLIYGLLTAKAIDRVVRCGVAHGALAMTTPGDTSMATLAELDRLIHGGSARIAR
jgi:2-dehydro-3-deoxygluconokinase